MDRDQIVKSLECCIHSGTCRSCPYDEVVGCIRKREADALDLIRELIEENELLKADVATEFTCVFGTPHKVGDCPIDEEVAKAKADTVREMAERLKAKAYTNNYCQEIVLESDIDRVAEEMLEEDA